MGHDVSKVLMGATQSSIRDVRSVKGSVAAGLALHINVSTKVASAAAAGAVLVGVSLGRDLSNAGFSAYAERGNKVPIQLGTAFTPTQGDDVWYDNTSGKAVASNGSIEVVALNAKFSFVEGSAKKSGIQEDGTLVDVAYIDFNANI